ncbi:MAG: glycosyltransferase family 4 protein, partial [Candidatus Colwellbacteria bacterium]
VTAAKASLRLESKKVVEVGHGINTKAFECERSWDLSSGPARILAVGRMSPIKDYETLLSAVSMVKDTTRIEVTIVGQPVMSNDFAYYERLKEMTRELNIQDGITFRGFVPYKDIPDYYKNSDFVVNLSPTGGLDKVVLEAMAAKAIVLVANQAFGPHLAGHQERLLFKFRDPRDLALKIERLAGSPREELEKISRELHHSVWNNHQLSSTINKISQLFT